MQHHYLLRRVLGDLRQTLTTHVGPLTNPLRYTPALSQHLAAGHTSESARSCRDDKGREPSRAAKAYQEEKRRKWREEAHASAVAADLEQLAALRKYLIFGKQAGISADSLIRAIDDYVESLTGDRRALHTQGHSIGGSR